MRGHRSVRSESLTHWACFTGEMGALRPGVGRRLRHLLVLAAFAALAFTAAPALSLDPYRPEAVDFEQQLPALERVAEPSAKRLAATRTHVHPGAGPVTYLSEVISAPARFDLAGIAGEMRPVEMRARTEDGEWSDWVETANGDPVYFGGADELQVRARAWRPAGRLHYVNVSGTATAGESLLTHARQAINGALLSAVSVIQPAAEAAPAKPVFVSRAAWGAKASGGGCKPRETPEYGRVKAAVVHHTVTASDYTEEEAPGIVLGICRFHRNANGWNDIGYNALVDRFGNLYVGRAGGIGKAVVGAHAQGYNAQTTGVAAIGTHTTTPISLSAENTFANYLAWKLPHHGIQARGKTRLISAGGSSNKYRSGRRIKAKHIVGHLRLDLTACPGGALKLQLKDIRRKAQARIGGKPIKKPPPKPPPDDGGTGGTGG
jgi:hypothetical protein